MFLWLGDQIMIKLPPGVLIWLLQHIFTRVTIFHKKQPYPRWKEHAFYLNKSRNIFALLIFTKRFLLKTSELFIIAENGSLRKPQSASIRAFIKQLKVQ